jgi:hypothetical protein
VVIVAVSQQDVTGSAVGCSASCSVHGSGLLT